MTASVRYFIGDDEVEPSFVEPGPLRGSSMRHVHLRVPLGENGRREGPKTVVRLSVPRSQPGDGALDLVLEEEL